jgi:hypothetical protein
MRSRPFQLSFDASLKIDFQGSSVTSDDGLVLGRELDERLRIRCTFAAGNGKTNLSPSVAQTGLGEVAGL